MEQVDVNRNVWRGPQHMDDLAEVDLSWHILSTEIDIYESDFKNI